jgi:hypothetical protein
MRPGRPVLGRKLCRDTKDCQIDQETRAISARPLALVTENEGQAASRVSALRSNPSAAIAALRSPGLAEAKSPTRPPK